MSAKSLGSVSLGSVYITQPGGFNPIASPILTIRVFNSFLGEITFREFGPVKGGMITFYTFKLALALEKRFPSALCAAVDQLYTVDLDLSDELAVLVREVIGGRSASHISVKENGVVVVGNYTLANTVAEALAILRRAATVGAYPLKEDLSWVFDDEESKWWHVHDGAADQWKCLEADFLE